VLRHDKPITFVGPTHLICDETNEGNAVVRPTWGFLVLQNPGEPIQLEYGTVGQANAVRKLMVKSGNAVGVKDLDLFSAIQAALKYVFEQGVEKSVGLQEAFIKETLEQGILHEGGDEILN